MSVDESASDATLAGANASPSASQSTQATVERGIAIGRYVVLGRLGAGAMGIVYLAYDPELDREVALKLVKPVAGQGDERVRLLREAQALAKLTHENVVVVHDAGTHEGRVWIAMEVVRGTTLRAWLDAATRSWSAVLDVMMRAGEGIRAAHAAGLMHRDIKPDNVMIGDDMRVRVMDFGLARPRGEIGVDVVPRDTKARPQLAALAASMTIEGAMIGTPAYMAPEQLAGEPVTAAADQFAFSVMLWEGLYRERPFAGATLHEIAGAVLEGRRRSPVRGVAVPRWLRRVVERGLAVEREDRWPSIDAMLDAIRRGRARARATRIAVVAGVAVVGIGAVAGARAIDRRSRVAACEDAGREIDAAWNDDERAAVRASFAATKLADAESSAERAIQWIDGRASAWSRVRSDACVAADVRGEWDANALDRSLWCLAEKRTELEVFVVELTHADAEAVRAAVSRAAALDPAEPCGDRDRLLRVPMPPDDRRDRVRLVREALAAAVGVERSGRYDEALAAAQAARTEAEAIGWPPIVAAAIGREATVRLRRAEYAEAEKLATESYFIAAEAGAWDLAAAVAIRLIHVVGYRLARPADGQVWAEHAAVALAHADIGTGELEARRLVNLATVMHQTGDVAGARATLSRAIEIQEQTLGPEHPDVARALVNLAQMLASSGDRAGSLELLSRALPIMETVLGPTHPDVATAVDAIGDSALGQGDLVHARERFEQSLAIREAAFGAGHRAVVPSLNGLAKVERAAGNPNAAQALDGRIAAIRGAGPAQ